jgi:hypothetical protein
MMPNYINYRKSISSELMSIKDRVRNFITHWPEDGRYKEVILKNVLGKHLPKTVSIGTGFVIGDDSRTSSQIDIIIYSNAIPPLFCIDDFVIVVKESVLGIIEVKTKINNARFLEMVEKSHRNGNLIGNHIFNGVFGYEAELTNNSDRLPSVISDSLREHSGYVNNIAFGEDTFMKYWPVHLPQNSYSRTPPDVPHYSFYRLEKLACGYFISNLIEDVYLQCEHSPIPDTLRKAIYPIEQTKEVHRIEHYEIEIR